MAKSERPEAWMKILVLIVSGIILKVWGIVILIVGIINWLITVFSGKRNKSLADFCEPWNTEMYKYMRYLTSVSNKRPFPFSDVERMSKFER
jgi:hypothetical protein